MNTENVESHLRHNYDRRLLLTYRSVKKYYFRVESVRLDIHFLKSCRSRDIIPKFLWFKTANRNLASSSAYKESQRRLLNAEINYKYQHLYKMKKMYRWSINLLQQYCPEDLFESLQQIITTISNSQIEKKGETIEKKLNGYRRSITSRSTVDRKVVTNFSTRILSNDETDCLAHGLDYGLVPRRFDEMNAVGNIEQFFHRVTDIFQHHKKLMADLKDKDKVIPDDIRVLSTIEMTLAGNLRGLTDGFRFQANRYRQKQYLVRTEQKQFNQLLKSLKEDRSIIVTRPDKGRGIVLMDKIDYISKMDTILNDSTKFKCLFVDPTITRENSLTNLLRRLRKNDYISEQFYNMARPTGSNPGRLYGLPKIHKENVPLRPVLSSIGTYNYGLAKVLKQMLSTIIQNEMRIKDTFAFVKELKSLPKSISEYKMVSFDIVSLYTNIPLDETIQIILNYLYDIEAPPPATMKRRDMQKLLEFATKSSHFLFNGKVYDQIDGVSMGSPLAPFLAEIFLQDFEKKHLPSFKEMGIVYWKRYVDDTFVLLDPEVSTKDICTKLSRCHPALKFTFEEERLPTEKDFTKWKHLTQKKDSTIYLLSFLDVLVERHPSVGFQTRVYRKDTFSGLITKWNSFVPKSYKYNAISSMTYRARKICSTYETLAEELDEIRDISLKNGYPIAFVESIIRRQLNLEISPRAVTPTTPEMDTVVLRVPYYGKPSQIYGQRVTAAVTKQYPLKKVRVVYDVTARIGQNFTTKDKISTELKSGVVYEATCPLCDDKYIGKTCRHLKTRVNEHLFDQKKVLSPPIPQPSADSTKTLTSNNANNPNNYHIPISSETRMIEYISTQRKRLPKPLSLTDKKLNQNQSFKKKRQLFSLRKQLVLRNHPQDSECLELLLVLYSGITLRNYFCGPN